MPSLFFPFLCNLFILVALVFVAVCGLSSVVGSGGSSLVRWLPITVASLVAHRLWLWGVGAPIWCAGSLLRWLLLWSTGSRCRGFSSGSAWTQLPGGMWHPPGPGIEPVSPALAGGLLSTVPPEKSPVLSFFKKLRCS